MSDDFAPNPIAHERIEAVEASRQSPWRPIATAPAEVWNFSPVDLWLSISASPRSMGMSDAFRVPDCWRAGNDGLGGTGPWTHYHNGEPERLAQEYITHWMPIPGPPSSAQAKDQQP